MVRQSEYLSELHKSDEAESIFLNMAPPCPSSRPERAVWSGLKGMNQFCIDWKKGKLFKCEKVLIKTSAPSICRSVNSFSLSAIPVLSSISCHSGFSSGALMSFIKSSCLIFL